MTREGQQRGAVGRVPESPPRSASDLARHQFLSVMRNRLGHILMSRGEEQVPGTTAREPL